MRFSRRKPSYRAVRQEITSRLSGRCRAAEAFQQLQKTEFPCRKLTRPQTAFLANPTIFQISLPLLYIEKKIKSPKSVTISILSKISAESLKLQNCQPGSENISRSRNHTASTSYHLYTLYLHKSIGQVIFLSDRWFS